MAGWLTGSRRWLLTGTSVVVLTAALVWGVAVRGGGGAAEAGAAQARPGAGALVGGSWSVLNGKALSPNARQYGVSVTFKDGGVVSAIDACIIYEGKWRSAGPNTVKVGGWTAIDRDCIGLGAVADQPLVKALSGEVTVRRKKNGEKLVLKAEGASALTLRPGGGMYLLPGMWFHMDDQPGSPWINADADQTYTLDFRCGLTISGTWAPPEGTSFTMTVDSMNGTCPSWDTVLVNEMLPAPPAKLLGETLVAHVAPRQGRISLSLATPSSKT